MCRSQASPSCGSWLSCAGAVEPAEEKCDLLDTDCDGLSDAEDDDARAGSCPGAASCGINGDVPICWELADSSCWNQPCEDGWECHNGDDDWGAYCGYCPDAFCACTVCFGPPSG